MSEQIDDNVIPLAPPRMVPPGLTSGDDSRGLPSLKLSGDLSLKAPSDLSLGNDGIWVSTADALRLFKVSEPTLYKWNKDGRISTRKVGRKNEWLFSDEMMAELEQASDKKKGGRKPEAGIGRFTPDDLGNAKRLLKFRGHDLKHASATGWYEFDGRVWRQDLDDKCAMRAAMELNEWIETEATETGDDSLYKWAARSRSRQGMSAAVSTYKTLTGATVDPSQFDQQPWLLNVQNGFIDLRDNEFYPVHDREHYATKLAGFEYDVDATCPQWEAFLNFAMQGDQELIKYLQRWCGYSLTGYTYIEEFLFVLGTRGTGKNTFVDRIRTIAGDYGDDIRPEAIMQKFGEAIPVDLAKLPGKRVVVSQEASDQHKWNESLIASLVGGGNITARFMARNEFSFKPVLKLFLHGNKRPRVSNTESGLFRRLREVEFNQSLMLAGKFETRGEPDFKSYLDKYELPGIANWCLEGWKEVQRLGGTFAPQSVLNRLQDLENILDAFGQFEADCLSKNYTLREGEEDPVVYIIPHLWERYTRWWGERSNVPTNTSHVALMEKLQQRGYKLEQDASGQWFVRGVILR